MSFYQNLMAEFPARPEQQVTIDNMQQGPFNRWAFADMRRLLPSANVWRGSGPVMSLEKDLVDIGGLEYETIDGQVAKVGALFTDDFTDGLVVLKDGVIVTEQYRDGFAAHEPHLLMSVSKSFAGSLAGVLVGQGRFSPEDLVTDILPEVAGSAYQGAQVRHVLDMTVAMDYDENYEDSDSDVALLDVAAGWRPYRPGAPDNLRDYIKTMRPKGRHGEVFHYISTNSDLLGWIIERAAGRDFASLLSELIWQPMGAEFDAYITLDRLGAPQTDGGLCVTTRDLARFGQLHLQQGQVGERQIIPADWILDFQHNGDREVWERGNFAETMPAHYYRSKWYSKLSDSHRPYLGVGIHGQFVFVDPVAAVVIAHHGSHPAPDEHQYFGNLNRAFSAISHYLGQKD